MKYEYVEFRPKAGLPGWVCCIFFTVETARQFTRERHAGVGTSRYWFVAYLRAWLDATRLHGQLKARPGRREVFGWV